MEKNSLNQSQRWWIVLSNVDAKNSKSDKETFVYQWKNASEKIGNPKNQNDGATWWEGKIDKINLQDEDHGPVWVNLMKMMTGARLKMRCSSNVQPVVNK